jgi:hypothetical protein
MTISEAIPPSQRSAMARLRVVFWAVASLLLAACFSSPLILAFGVLIFVLSLALGYGGVLLGAIVSIVIWIGAIAHLTRKLYHGFAGTVTRKPDWLREF